MFLLDPKQVGRKTANPEALGDTVTGPAYARAFYVGNSHGSYSSIGNGAVGATPVYSMPTQHGSHADFMWIDTVSVGGSYIRGNGTSGSYWGWGYNGYGFVGDGTTTNRTSPVQIGSLTDWVNVTHGRYHSLALKTNGTVWAWGHMNYGSSGLTYHASSPAQLTPSSGWTMTSAVTDSSGGVRNGKMYCWGRNSFGNMGNGTTVNIDHNQGPTQIGSATDWRHVHQHYHGLHAIKTNGTLWGCGMNTHGQIGDGTTVDKSSPVQIGTDTDWQDITGNYTGPLALKTDGTLWSWGKWGGLAHGNYIDLSVPTQIGTETYWESICSLNGGYMARRTDGKMYAFGRFFNGAGYWASGSLGYVTSPTMCGSVGGTTWDQAPTTHMSLKGQNFRGKSECGFYTY